MAGVTRCARDRRVQSGAEEASGLSGYFASLSSFKGVLIWAFALMLWSYRRHEPAQRQVRDYRPSRSCSRRAFASAWSSSDKSFARSIACLRRSLACSVRSILASARARWKYALANDFALS
jgi:hypothetical protein